MKKRTPGGEYEVIGLEEPTEEYRIIRCRREDTEESCTILEFQDETLTRKLLPLFYELWKSVNWEVCRECFVSDGKLCVVWKERNPGEETSLRELLEAFYEQAEKIPGTGGGEADAVQELYRVSAEPDEPAAKDPDRVKTPDEEHPEPAALTFRERLYQWFRKWESVIQVVLFLIVYTAGVLLLLYGFRELKGIGDREKGPRYQTIGTLDLQ